MVKRFPVWMLGFITLSLITTPPVYCNVSCRGAMVTLLPCKTFLTVTAVNITHSCCDDPHALLKSTEAVSDHSQQAARQQMYWCLKNQMASAKINQDKASQIPRLCKIIFFPPIDPGINFTTLRALSKRGDRLKHHKKTGIKSLKNDNKVKIYYSRRRFVARNMKQHYHRFLGGGDRHES